MSKSNRNRQKHFYLILDVISLPCDKFLRLHQADDAGLPEQLQALGNKDEREDTDSGRKFRARRRVPRNRGL